MMRFRIVLFILMLIRIQIKVLLLIIVMQICNFWSTDPSRLHFEQEVTRRCRLSWLTDSALVRALAWAQMREEGWGGGALSCTQEPK
jgi:hypothetical protein